MFSADVFAALTHALDVWDNSIALVVIATFIVVTDCPLISVGLLFLFDVSSALIPFWVLASFRALLRWSFSSFTDVDWNILSWPCVLRC